MEVIIIVFTAIIQNDPEMKQELETSIFSTPFLFMSIFIFPSLDADPFIHISEGSRLHLSFCHQHLPLATKLWPEVPVSHSHHVIPPWSLTPSTMRQEIDPPHSQSEGRTRASLSSAYALWAFGELLGLVSLFSRCDCPTSPLCTPPPWSLISLGWDAGAGQVFPQGGRRAGPSAAGLAGSRPAQARSRLCARASYIMETSRSRSGRVTSYLIF